MESALFLRVLLQLLKMGKSLLWSANGRDSKGSGAALKACLMEKIIVGFSTGEGRVILREGSVSLEQRSKGHFFRPALSTDSRFHSHHSMLGRVMKFIPGIPLCLVVALANCSRRLHQNGRKQ